MPSYSILQKPFELRAGLALAPDASFAHVAPLTHSCESFTKSNGIATRPMGK